MAIAASYSPDAIYWCALLRACCTTGGTEGRPCIKVLRNGRRLGNNPGLRLRAGMFLSFRLNKNDLKECDVTQAVYCEISET